jgi:hypothetical protein
MLLGVSGRRRFRLQRRLVGGLALALAMLALGLALSLPHASPERRDIPLDSGLRSIGWGAIVATGDLASR